MSWTSFTTQPAAAALPATSAPQSPLLPHNEPTEVIAQSSLVARTIAIKPAPVDKSWAHLVAGGYV